MHPMRKLAVLLSVIAFAAACTGEKGSDLDSLYEGLPFEMSRISLPSIPARSVSLTEFGGTGDGVTLNTDAFGGGSDAPVTPVSPFHGIACAMEHFLPEERMGFWEAAPALK